ncbi:hypothetical protein C5167_042472, partial [Papaver somniferum]
GFGVFAAATRVFVGHSIYKGKAALTVEPISPEFLPLEVFSLSVTEIAALMNLGLKDSCEFFHDPFKGKSSPTANTFKIHHVQNKLLNVDENIYIPVTKAELTVLNSAFSYILPYLLGWHTFVNSVKPSDTSRVNNNTNMRSGAETADLEWSK